MKYTFNQLHHSPVRVNVMCLKLLYSSYLIKFNFYARWVSNGHVFCYVYTRATDLMVSGKR